MPIHRRRFRVEEPFVGGMSAAVDGDAGPMHHEIMTELRALRAQMAGPGRSAAIETTEASLSRETAEARALLETYRAQIGHSKKLTVYLHLIHHPTHPPNR